jgi:hypothetical protein
MLFADKQALETELKVSLLAIRERELTLYAGNSRNIANISCMLAGFAYVTLTFEHGNEDVFSGVTKDEKWIYELVAFAALLLNVGSMFGAMACSMLGPGLALRGGDGAMDQAVEGLALEYRTTFAMFLFGVISYYACFSIFLMLDTQPGWGDWFLHLALVLCFLLFLRSTLAACKRIYKLFRLPPQHAIAGSFDPDGLVPKQSEQSKELERLSQHKVWYQWPRRQYLYAMVFMNEFVGISKELFEERYKVHGLNQIQRGSRRPNNFNLHRIIRHLERPNASRTKSGSGFDGTMTTSSTLDGKGGSPSRGVRRGSWLMRGGGRHRTGHGEETMSLPASVSSEVELSQYSQLDMHSKLSPSDHLNSGAISPAESDGSSARFV